MQARIVEPFQLTRLGAHQQDGIARNVIDIVVARFLQRGLATDHLPHLRPKVLDLFLKHAAISPHVRGDDVVGDIGLCIQAQSVRNADRLLIQQFLIARKNRLVHGLLHSTAHRWRHATLSKEMCRSIKPRNNTFGWCLSEFFPSTKAQLSVRRNSVVMAICNSVLASCAPRQK